ncbi:MAG TPA: polyprenyl synthetase family protein [Oscillatoriaceae cyanobacterium]
MEAVKRQLDAILAAAELPEPLAAQASAVLAKAYATYERTPHWPVVELPRRLLAALGGPAALGDGLAAAALLFYAAADVIDDAQDDELAANPAWRGWSWQEAVNCGNLLLFLSQRTFLTLKAPQRVRLEWGRRFAEVGVRMAAGQCRDLYATADAPYDEAGVLRVAEEKVGAYWGAIAALAPVWAGRKDVEAWHTLGCRIGVLYQVATDVWAYMTPEPHQDVALGKLTLPLAFARMIDPGLPALWASGPLDAEAQAAARARVAATGAVTYGGLRVEILRKEAHDSLMALDCPEAEKLLLPLIEGVSLQAPISASA